MKNTLANPDGEADRVIHKPTVSIKVSEPQREGRPAIVSAERQIALYYELGGNSELAGRILGISGRMVRKTVANHKENGEDNQTRAARLLTSRR